MLSVLAEREVAANFLRVPGSCGFHHAEPGGLLQHSLEVVEPILVWPGLDQETRDLAAAAALFHDIGKIRTIKPDGGSTELGGLVSHDSLNLVICEPALRALEMTWRNGCYAIMHILTAGMGRYGYDRKMLASHLVGVADRREQRRQRPKSRLCEGRELAKVCPTRWEDVLARRIKPLVSGHAIGKLTHGIIELGKVLQRTGGPRLGRRI